MTVSPEDIRHSVETESGRIVYYEMGSGHPVLMLHGSGPGSTGFTNFANNIEWLSKHFRVLAPDMPGWGGSSPATAETIDHVESAKQFLDAVGVDKAAFVGNSMGGHTSLRFSVTHPDRISHLVTMGSPVPGANMYTPGDGPSEGLKVLIDTYKDPSVENMARVVNVMSYDKSLMPPDLLQSRSEAAKAYPEHLKNFLDGLPGMSSSKEEKRPSKMLLGELKGAHKMPLGQLVNIDELSRVQAPSLLIHGRDDRVVSFETTLRLLSVIPNSRSLIFNRCGHWAQAEHFEEFNRAVLDFVNNN